MKKLFIIIPLVLVGMAVLFVFASKQQNQAPSLRLQKKEVRAKEKIYVALEEEGAIAVIDPLTRQVTTRIDLSEESDGARAQYMPHNAQVAPNGKTVWVTANVMEADMEDMIMEKSAQTALDEVIVIDPLSDRIIKRIPIGSESHLAHVAVTPDNETAYVTSQEKGEVYAISAKTYAVENTITIGAGSGPHGLRMSMDGSKAFIALLAGKALAVLDTQNNMVKKYPVDSGAVQTAVTTDGKYAFTSLYTTKQIMRLDIASGEIAFIDLPKEAKGPVQLYATPDSRFLYVADQGYYFDQPESMLVYRIDIEKSVVDQTIPAGTAPHGVVVDKQGIFAYITNLLSNDVSVIDIAQGKEISKIPVGKMPNGISIWNNEFGGTQ